AIGAFEENIAAKMLMDANPWVRVWAIRLLGESPRVSSAMVKRLVDLASNDPAPEVRLQLAATAQRLPHEATLPPLQNLMKHVEDANDPCIPLMIWLACEPGVAAQSELVLNWLKDHAAGNPLVTNEIVPRAMRRLVASNQAEKMAA